MSGQFFLGNVTGNPLGNNRGSSTRLLLLVLLLVAAAAGYLYFFTDMITPHKEMASAPPPVAVKQPLPPRPGQAEAVKPGEVPPAAPAAAAPPVNPAPVPAPPKGQPEQKPAPAKVEPAKSAASPAPAKPVAPAAAAPKPQAPAAAPAPPKPAVAASVPAGKKAPAPAPAKTGEKTGKKKGGAYRLLVGDFGPDKTLATVLAKLKKSGIAPVRKSVVTANEQMNRIFVGRYTDQDKAETERGMVKKITGDAFLIADNGGYSLYAGSYLSATRAAAEQKKLGARGYKAVIKKVRLPVRVTRVTAGSYAGSSDAHADAAKLKKLGIKATVIKMK
jgi:cell division septation protein DedD